MTSPHPPDDGQHVTDGEPRWPRPPVEFRDGREMGVRPATGDDLPALGRLWAEAFPDGRPADARADDVEEGRPYGGLETAWLGELDGGLAGAFRAYRFSIHLFGRAFPAMGVGMLAVAPEFRRRGVGEALMREALRVGLERGDALALLYPRRVSFYERLGFSLAGELHRYHFPTDDLPLFPRRDEVRRLHRDRCDEVMDHYARALPGGHGFFERSEAMWEELFRPPRRVYGLGDPLEGYVVVEPRDDGPGGPHLHVRELVATDHEAYRGLLGWLSAQRDQWEEVVHDAVPGEAFHRVLEEARPRTSTGARDLWFESARLLRGPMARILDAGAVLGSEVGLGTGNALPLVDPVLEENRGLWRRSEEGLSRFSPEEGGPTEGLPVGLVTELFLGGTLPGQAERVRDWSPTLGLSDLRLLHEF